MISGPRLLLRRPVVDDADALFTHIGSDREVARYLVMGLHPDVEHTRSVIATNLNTSEQYRTWVIELRGAGEVVGLISCRRDTPHSAELGSCLGRRWWGEGFMSEVLAVLIPELAADPQMYRVWATCHVDNVRVTRTLERSGFALEGRLARHSVYPAYGSEPLDSLLYARILR